MLIYLVHFCLFYQVQIGKDPGNLVNAMFHLVQIGGDGKMLEELCGCFHSRFRFCRICLETRRGLFTSPAEPADRRRDDEHESVSFHVAGMDALIVENHMQVGSGVPGAHINKNCYKKK